MTNSETGEIKDITSKLVKASNKLANNGGESGKNISEDDLRGRFFGNGEANYQYKDIEGKVHHVVITTEVNDSYIKVKQ